MNEGTAATRAKRKYNEKAYDRLYVTAVKGSKECIETHATAQGESLNAFINRAIEEQMKRDKEKAPSQS